MLRLHIHGLTHGRDTDKCPYHVLVDRYRGLIVMLLFSESGPLQPRPWFNIKIPYYLYRKSHCGDKTILRPSYLHNGISYTGKMTSLYWIRALLLRSNVNSLPVTPSPPPIVFNYRISMIFFANDVGQSMLIIHCPWMLQLNSLFWQLSSNQSDSNLTLLLLFVPSAALGKKKTQEGQIWIGLSSNKYIQSTITGAQ